MGLLTGLWRALLRHRAISIGAAVVMLAVVLPIAYYLFSPLFIRTTLQEASPLDVAASVASTSAPATPSAPVSTSAPAAGTQAASAGASTPAPSVAAPAPAGAAPASTPASTPASGPRVVARGMFAGADDFHFGRGDALLIEVTPQRHTLRFENFSVRNGPDLFVYLSDDPAGYGGAVLKLGALRATDGAFNYEIPAGTDISRFRSAIVWCDQFATLFATAALK